MTKSRARDVALEALDKGPVEDIEALKGEEKELVTTIRGITTKEVVEEVRSSHSGDGTPLGNRMTALRLRSASAVGSPEGDEEGEESDALEESDAGSSHSSFDMLHDGEDLAQARREVAAIQESMGIAPGGDANLSAEDKATRRRQIKLDSAVSRLDEVQSKLIIASIRGHEKVKPHFQETRNKMIYGEEFANSYTEQIQNEYMSMGEELAVLVTIMDVLDTWPIGDEVNDLEIARAISSLIRPLSRIPHIRTLLVTHGWTARGGFAKKPSYRELFDDLFILLQSRLRTNLKEMQVKGVFPVITELLDQCADKREGQIRLSRRPRSPSPLGGRPPSRSLSPIPWRASRSGASASRTWLDESRGSGGRTASTAASDSGPCGSGGRTASSAATGPGQDGWSAWRPEISGANERRDSGWRYDSSGSRGWRDYPRTGWYTEPTGAQGWSQGPRRDPDPRGRSAASAPAGSDERPPLRRPALRPRSHGHDGAKVAGVREQADGPGRQRMNQRGVARLFDWSRAPRSPLLLRRCRHPSRRRPPEISLYRKFAED